MSPREDGRTRPFGKQTKKKVKVEGEVFATTYVMDKVLIREGRATNKQREEDAKKFGYPPAAPKAKVHGPHMNNFEYVKLLPKKVNGRWRPGKWLPLIAQDTLRMCANGYHVTTMRFRKNWGADNPGAHVYLVECVGPLTAPKSRRPQSQRFHYGNSGDVEKYVFRSIRLLRLVG